MIPAAFDYEAAESVEEAVALLAEHGEEAKLLAGGQSLLPLMKLRLATPAVLVDLGRVGALRFVEEQGEHIAFGALTPIHALTVHPLVREHCGLLADAARQLGTPAVRHLGTLGGALAHGDPASDLPSAALALDAEIVARGPGGERVLPVSELYRDFLETALTPGEVVTEVRVHKLPPGAGFSYQKFSHRSQDWATVGVAAVVERADGVIASARLGLTNMGATPLRARACEAALTGVGPQGVAEAAARADEGAEPTSDLAGSAEYRRHLARVLTRRAVEQALGA